MNITKYLQHRFALSQTGAKEMIKGCLMCALHNFALMFPVGLTFYFVGDLFNGNDVSNYLWQIVICLIIIALTYYLQYNKTYYSTYIESGVRRIAIAEKLRKLPLSFFAKKDLADLTTTIMSDCAYIETASSHWIEEFFGAIVSTFFICISLFFFDWKMALASIWPLPISLTIVALSPKVMKAFNQRQMDAKIDLADGIQECLETMRELKMSNAENAYIQTLEQKIDRVESKTMINEWAAASFVVPAQIILKIGIATTALVGGIMFADEKIDLMMMFMFLLVASRLYDPMSGALTNLAAIISTQVPCSRMNEILEGKTQQGSEILDNNGYDIDFKDVSFTYNNSETVLNNVTFTAKQSEVTALVGPSGGGKTTVSRLAARFWDVSGGKITVGGMDVSKTDPERLLSLFSIVFQDVTLFNNTVLENIRIGRKNATDEEVIAAAKLAHCEEFVEKLPQKWNTDIGENGSRLSGGERQRISIARAFLKDAPIILLDEATSSLDVENESLIQQSLSQLIKNKTVMIIAHRMRTISGADKIVVLKDGKVSQQGSPEQLLKEGGFFKDMLEKQR